MPDSTHGERQDGPGGRRLDSWKEIAAYLRRDTRTVQRWERHEGLPVHRLRHSRLGSVFAYTAELDVWRKARESAPRTAHAVSVPFGLAARQLVRVALVIAVAASVAAAAFVLVLRHARPSPPPGSIPSAALPLGEDPTNGILPYAPLHISPSPEAYESYLKGWFFLRRGEEDVTTSVREFERATARDPTFAAAYVGLANAYERLGGTGVGVLPVIEAGARAVKAARTALAADPNLSGARVILATALQQQWRWDNAEAELRRVLEIDPGNSAALGKLGSLLLWRGRTEDGLAYARRARDADPLSISRTVDLAWLLYHARRYDDSIRELRTVLAVEPDHRVALWFLGFALIDSSRADEAVPLMEHLAEMRKRNPAVLGLLARAYGRVGRHADARRLLHELQQREHVTYVPPAPFVHAYAGLEDRDGAFVALERAYREHSNIVLFLKTHPLYDPLRGDPRFSDLLRRVGLD